MGSLLGEYGLSMLVLGRRWVASLKTPEKAIMRASAVEVALFSRQPTGDMPGEHSFQTFVSWLGAFLA